MDNLQIDFKEAEMKPIFERFKLLFSPQSAKSDIPSDIKVCVWIWMINAFHPTVKPLSLMRYLITLITPPDGVILDPFMGSGSTLCAAKQLGFSAIGIEQNPDYCDIARHRIDVAQKNVFDIDPPIDDIPGQMMLF